jgi:hypothetical protein
VSDIDKTGVFTVLYSPNIGAQIGMKQVGQALSGEQGTMITICMIIISVGNTLPPVFIIPSARLHDTDVGCNTWKLGIGE